MRKSGPSGFLHTVENTLNMGGDRREVWRAETVRDADELLRQLFPICRSLSGDGVRDTLATLKGIAKFGLVEIPSGTSCYDWTVPKEWNIEDAFIADVHGRRLVDFHENNLHVVNYSVPVDEVLSFSELRPRLHTLPDMADAIPYRTTYYREDWGFCLTQEQFDALDRSATYHARIDSRLEAGSMTIGERTIGGDSPNEFLMSTYCCHPSLANDNLSGIVLWVLLLRELESRSLRHRYRFVVLPETIGAIAYLSRHEEEIKLMTGGYVITTVAGPGPFGYKRSYLGDHLIDQAAQIAFRDLGRDFIDYPFDVHGSDESHYSAPHFRIPVGTICKDKYYEYDYYHTSLDNLDFIDAEHLVSTLEIYLETVDNLERNVVCRSLNPWCEPMLGKHGLFPSLGGQIRQSVRPGSDSGAYELNDGSSITESDLSAILWIMFMTDGTTSLLSIAEKTGIPMARVERLAKRLCDVGLLEMPVGTQATFSRDGT